ncbi:hypothetical protein HMPREF9346_04116 [Escherichia coli MS 119-7]|nr:hypothetical protein HMPREF9346_04116 [Escherichia coli MS 119-7]
MFCNAGVNVVVIIIVLFMLCKMKCRNDFYACMEWCRDVLSLLQSAHSDVFDQ